MVTAKKVEVTDKKGGVTGHVTRYKTCVAIKMITDKIYVAPGVACAKNVAYPQTPLTPYGCRLLARNNNVPQHAIKSVKHPPKTNEKWQD